MNGHVETYTDTAGEHRWRIVHSNGQILADSAEGYSRAIDCTAGLEATTAILRSAHEVREVDQ